MKNQRKETFDCAGQQVQSVAADKEINVLELLLVLIKRKMFICAVTLGSAVIAAMYSLTLPNIYSATVKVLPPGKDTAALSSVLGQMGGLAGVAAGGLGGGNMDLYVGILKSRRVADAVVKRLNLVKVYDTKTGAEARERVDAAIKTQVGKDGILCITIENKDPQHAALLANTLADELGQALISLNLTKVSSERAFLEKRLEVVRKDLKLAEERMKEFSGQNKVVQVESQASASLTAVANLKAEISDKEVQLAVLRSRQTDESPEVKSTKAALEKVRREVAKLTGKNGNVDGIPSIGNVPGLALEYARRMRELKTQEGMFDQLTKQYELAKLNEAKDSSSLQVLDEAVVPTNKCKPRRSVIVMFTALAGFIFAVVAAFVLEFFLNTSDHNKKLLESIKKAAVT